MFCVIVVVLLLFSRLVALFDSGCGFFVICFLMFGFDFDVFAAGGCVSWVSISEVAVVCAGTFGFEFEVVCNEQVHVL